MVYPIPTTLFHSDTPDGLVARWTLDDASAGYIDQVNGYAFTTGGAGVSTAAGIIGDAAAFNGTTSAYLQALSRANLQVRAGFAAETWARRETTVNNGIIAKSNAGGTDFEYIARFDRDSAGAIRLLAAGSINILGSTSVPLSTWAHVVIAYGSDARWRIYLNGVLQVTSAISTHVVNTRNFGVGGIVSSFPLNGRIDETAVWQFGSSGDPGAAYWLDRYNGGAGRRP